MFCFCICCQWGILRFQVSSVAHGDDHLTYEVWGSVLSTRVKTRSEVKFKIWKSCACLCGLRSLGLENVFWWALWLHKWLWLLWYHLKKCANIFSEPNFPVGQLHGSHKIVCRERFLFHLWKCRSKGLYASESSAIELLVSHGDCALRNKSVFGFSTVSREDTQNYLKI